MGSQGREKDRVERSLRRRGSTGVIEGQEGDNGVNMIKIMKIIMKPIIMYH